MYIQKHTALCLLTCLCVCLPVYLCIYVCFVPIWFLCCFAVISLDTFIFNVPICQNWQVPGDFLRKQTPAMKQWWTIKSENFDTILFFKVCRSWCETKLDVCADFQLTLVMLYCAATSCTLGILVHLCICTFISEFLQFSHCNFYRLKF